ncbi:hypothetical protein Agabi119p4_213 [Agaricus bisporus var. burnettii]|uniref:VHS domain-containing protein n=1 Tax=Agaricus bisporus var. burnettii TaxID=192524 RepID=A0A8H7FA82_AGABI|nr:hypothetical protein Agabi119p4_213 [Agaricus bisporus var. burnettii]
MALSGFNIKQAFGREKPHSSITDWVEIMTAPQTEEESFEGVFELVDAINLQASGPSEAARALRKKMKHGGAHQQYRAIVIMRSLIDNVPQKMKLAFSDSQFLDVLSGILLDEYINKRVKKKLTVVLLAWQDQFKDDSEMAAFQRLYSQVKGKNHRLSNDMMMNYVTEQKEKDAKKEKEKREAREARKREEAEERERIKKEKEMEKERSKKDGRKTETRKRLFDFEKDKPKVMNSIVEASQASSNLINAIVRVNLETDSLEGNAEVQDWLTKAKDAKKVIVRYTQLVENEEIIGTLIETHERLEAALNTYIDLTTNDDATELAAKVADVALKDSEVRNKHGPATVDSHRYDATAGMSEPSRESGSKSPYDDLHPDLADLDFKSDARHLPPPMRPTTFKSDDESDRDDRNDKRGSLSDYSDYDSSDEGGGRAAPAKRKSYVTVSDDSGAQLPMVVGPSNQQPIATHASAIRDDDPFADPFADKR